MKTALAALIVGYGLDLLLGDPSFLYHPIRVIGNLIALLEKWLRKVFPKTPKGELAGGVFLVILVCLAGYGVPALLLFAAFKIHPVIGFLLEVLWCWQIPATKCLKDESMKVYQKLKENDLPGARYAVSMIVGRDTENLSETGVTKAAVETIAENTSDGVIAPLLFLAIGGPALGFLYKSINTMDSMVGYKNDKYLYFGRCAAKLDDVVKLHTGENQRMADDSCVCMRAHELEKCRKNLQTRPLLPRQPKFCADRSSYGRGAGSTACRRCRVFRQSRKETNDRR